MVFIWGYPPKKHWQVAKHISRLGRVSKVKKVLPKNFSHALGELFNQFYSSMWSICACGAAKLVK